MEWKIKCESWNFVECFDAAVHCCELYLIVERLGAINGVEKKRLRVLLGIRYLDILWEHKAIVELNVLVWSK